MEEKLLNSSSNILHGFLGLPGDFNFLNGIAHGIKPASSMEEWAIKFNKTTTGSTLIGYSMGGRLALHAWKQDPTRWKKLILISTSPGLAPKEREARLINDYKWADRFEKDDWDHVVRDWNNQEVLKSFNVPRKEADFDRKELAEIMRNFSVAKQEIIEPHAIWIVGENDHKLRQRISHLNPIVIPKAGHRLPWEAQKELRSIISEALEF